MRRLIAVVLASTALLAPSALAKPKGPTLQPPSGLRGAVTAEKTVRLGWNRVSFPSGTTNQAVLVRRDGQVLATLSGAVTAFEDRTPPSGRSLAYSLVSRATFPGRKTVTSKPSNTVRLLVPGLLVGAATADISPDLVGLGVINQGGNGIGDAGHPVAGRLDPGSRNRTTTERIRARAIVLDDGREVVALATIETQGWFIAYRHGRYGTSDMAAAVARDIPRLRADHILIAADHTHAGPDTIGAWGGVPDVYFQLVREQTIRAIEQAYANRRPASVVFGESDASDLIYNQSCTEALNQSPEPAYRGPQACASAGKDGMVRILQARDGSGRAIATFMAFAAHATAGGGDGVHGDWPQFLGDAMAAEFGGVGLAFQGAVGNTQPCRPTCGHTNRRVNPGVAISNRKQAIVANYLRHVRLALARATPVQASVGAGQTRIREQVTGPAVLALFTAGGHAGARLLRSHDSPWAVGATVATLASAIRIGRVLVAGTPGEGYNAIGEGIRAAIAGEQAVIPIGLANDQLGYLIAPARDYPAIAALAAVNDNAIFNVSPTIGDHVMCADIAIARRLGFEGGDSTFTAYCAPYAAADATGDPLGRSPVGGVVLD